MKLCAKAQYSLALWAVILMSAVYVLIGVSLARQPAEARRMVRDLGYDQMYDVVSISTMQGSAAWVKGYYDGSIARGQIDGKTAPTKTLVIKWRQGKVTRTSFVPMSQVGGVKGDVSTIRFVVDIPNDANTAIGDMKTMPTVEFYDKYAHQCELTLNEKLYDLVYN